MIYLTINGQEMTGTITSPIVCGQVNFVEIKTFFDSTWDGFDKAYQFSNNGGKPVEIVSNDDIISLPYEASIKSGTVDISVTGTILDDDGLKVVKKVTANSLRFKVWDCNSVDDPNNVGEVTPTVVEQIRQIAEHAESVSNEMLRAKENGEFDGKDGVDGKDGKDGVVGRDGISPTVVTEQTTTGALITITDVSGNHTVELLNGKDGKDGINGKDGKDGTMSFEELTDDQKATLKGDPGKDGVDGKDGINGKDGVDGKDGDPGKDGYSPIAKVTQTSTGASIVITDQTGTTTATILNGKDGEPGKDGNPGKDGSNGVTPHIGTNGNWWIGDVDTGVKASGSGGTGGSATKNILFDAEWTKTGEFSPTNTLSDSIYNYDLIYVTTFQRKNETGATYTRMMTFEVIPDLIQEHFTGAVGNTLWTVECNTGNNLGYAMEGNFGDGTQIAISTLTTQSNATSRLHGICKVIGIKF